MLFECPYGVGTRFSVLLKRFRPDAPGTVHKIEVEVVRTFPFTKSQGMQVALTSKPEDASLPSTAFLKLYDRRYIDERTGRVEQLCWNPNRELQAQRTARLIRKRYVRDDLKVPHPDSRPKNGGVDAFVDPHDYYEWEHASSLGDAGAGQWEIERNFRARMRREFQTECQVYHRLHDLQGRCVPEFYGATTFVESSKALLGFILTFSVFYCSLLRAPDSTISICTHLLL